MIKCIIVDDEPLALDLLEDYLRQIPDVQLVKKCNSAAMAEEVLSEHDIQLMFLDIHMPDVSGIQFLQSLKMQNRPKVVFTTAYNQYAIQGFELDAIDYLMKPFSFERFLKTMHKVSNLLQHTPKEEIHAPNTEYIFIKSEYKIYKIDLKDIIYIEGLKDYSKLYTTTGNILTLKSLKAVETMLPKNAFVRVHRSYIIAINKIKLVSKSLITTVTDVNIPISEGFKDQLNYIINANHV